MNAPDWAAATAALPAHTYNNTAWFPSCMAEAKGVGEASCLPLTPQGSRTLMGDFNLGKVEVTHKPI